MVWMFPRLFLLNETEDVVSAEVLPRVVVSVEVEPSVVISVKELV